MRGVGDAPGDASRGGAGPPQARRAAPARGDRLPSLSERIRRCGFSPRFVSCPQLIRKHTRIPGVRGVGDAPGDASRGGAGPPQARRAAPARGDRLPSLSERIRRCTFSPRFVGCPQWIRGRTKTPELRGMMLDAQLATGKPGERGGVSCAGSTTLGVFPRSPRTSLYRRGGAAPQTWASNEPRSRTLNGKHQNSGGARCR